MAESQDVLSVEMKIDGAAFNAAVKKFADTVAAAVEEFNSNARLVMRGVAK